MTTSQPSVPARVGGLNRRHLILSGVALAAGCGGGSSSDVAQAPSTRAIPAEFYARKAVAYSPYRTALNEAQRANEVITPAMILQDLQLLRGAGYGLIRLFDSSDKVAKQTLQVIRANRLDIKMMLGIYILSGDGAATNAEIARGIALANDYRDEVLAVSVGNETAVSWSFNRYTSPSLAAHIRTVRQAVTQPVTTDDNWAFFAQAYSYEQDPGPVLDTVDFVALHTYPLLDSVYAPDLWDWRQAAVPPAQRAQAMMDAAMGKAKSDYAAARAKMNALGFSHLPIIIGETGWKADPASVPGRSHPVNQKMYLDALAAWKASGAGPKTIVAFEAFDEPWKQGDDKWGLFNVQRQARYAIQDVSPPSTWEPGAYTAADAVYVKSLSVRSPVTASRYTLYADTLTSGEARPSLAGWNAWENGTTANMAETTTQAAPGDAGHSLLLTPRPLVWGWGIALTTPTETADDLSAFVNGTIHFSVRTLYPGRIEVGFLSGSSIDGTAFDAYLAIAPGERGYANDGNWHQVSIPVADLRQAVAAAAGVPLARVDLSRVTNPFVIADRYSVTGKASGSGSVETIALDNIHWTK